MALYYNIYQVLIMKIKKIFIAVIMLAISMQVFALSEVYDKIILKDGSVVEGHIVSQIPGKNITFATVQSVVDVPQQAIPEVVAIQKKVSDIETQWHHFFSEHPEFIKNKGNTGVVTLSKFQIYDAKDDSIAVDSMEYTLSSLQKLFLAKMSNHMIYIYAYDNMYRLYDLTAADYLFELGDVKIIERINTIDGLVDVIQTRDGKIFRGQITKQILGKSVYMLLDKTKQVEIIDIKDIAKQCKETLNQNQNIVEKVPFLDVVITADNKTYRGVNILQNYGNADQTSYLVIHTSYGNDETVEIRNVRQLLHVKNDAYKPQQSLSISSPDDVYICRQIVEPIRTRKTKNGVFIVKKQESDKYLTLSMGDIGGTLEIEMQNTKGNDKAILLPVSANQLKEYVFTYENLLKDEVAPTSSVINNGNICKKFSAVANQTYILFHPESETVRLIEVK